MAKKKSKKTSGGFITRIVAIALAVLSFVSMAFKFLTQEGKLTSTKLTMNEWFDLIELFKKGSK